MKKYYQTLSDEEKRKVKNIYERDYGNSDLAARLIRLKFYALISYVCASIILAYSLVFEANKVGSIIIAVTLMVLGTVYFVGSIVIKLDVLNKIALENK
ncbi:MAG: hypothetical protein NC483_02945 [Ruminococcus sp.]|nr:hypothetical protein [Ruminococcus sp.]